MALLRRAQDVNCAKAFQLGVEEARASIFRRHLELDLSFLRAEEYDVRTPAAEASEETEYEEVSDVDCDDQKGETLPSEAKASEIHTFEVGGPSQTSSMPIVDSPEIGPAP